MKQPETITRLLGMILTHGPAAMEQATENQRIHYAGLDASDEWPWDEIPEGGMTWGEYWQLPESIEKMERITAKFTLTTEQVKQAIYNRLDHLYAAMHCG